MPSRFLRLSDHNLFLLTHFLPNREDTAQYDPLASRFPLTIGPSPVLLTHFLPNREHTALYDPCRVVSSASARTSQVTLHLTMEILLHAQVCLTFNFSPFQSETHPVTIAAVMTIKVWPQ